MIGHPVVRRALETQLPPVTLLQGPASIGKWTLAEHVAATHGVHPADTFTRETLRIDDVRAAVDFVATAPFGPFKLVLARLDDSGPAALNAALKILEEPPASARFLLTCAGRTLPTVESRCRVFRMGLLDPRSVHDILLRHKIPEHVASKVAARNLGRVDLALAVARDNDEHQRAAVLALVQAIAGRDRDAFDAVFRAWDDATARMFMQWLHEAATGIYSTYTQEEMFGFHRHKHLARQLIEAVGRTSRARSRLGIRAALEPFVARS